MRRVALALFFLLFFSFSVYPQSTTISGQVTDTNSQAWNSGTISFQFLNLNPQGGYVWSGGPFSPNAQINASLNATGGYSGVSVPSNTSINPANSQWRVVVCSGTVPASCISQNVTIIGATQVINFTPTPPIVPPGAGNSAYADNEIQPAVVGSQYYNLVSQVIRVCQVVTAGTCTTWAAAGGGVSSSPVNLVLAGDSQTRGGTPGSTPLSTPVSAYNSLLFVANKGIDGDTCSNMITEGSTVIDPLFVAGNLNILHVWCGTNDMCSGGATVAATFTNLKTYIAARRAVGWKVIVATMLSRTGTNPVGGETCDVDATNYDALIRTNFSTFADGLNDFGGNLSVAPPGTFSNTTYFVADGIHPSTASVNQILAPMVFNSVITLSVQNSTTIAKPAAIAVAHTGIGGGSGSTASITSTAMAVNTGNILACHVRFASSTSISTIADTAGNTFTQLASSTANSTIFEWFYAKNIIAHPSDIVTVTLAAGVTFTGLYCWELVGVDRVNPFDNQAFASGASSGTATTPAFSTTVPNEIVLVIDDSNGVNSTFTAGSGYTADSTGFPTGAGNLYAGAEHQILSTAQASITGVMSHSPNATWQIHAAIFRGANLQL